MKAQACASARSKISLKSLLLSGFMGLMVLGQASGVEAKAKEADHKTEAASKAKASDKTSDKSPEKSKDKSGDKSSSSDKDKTYPDGGLTASEMVADLKAEGFKADTAKDANGDPLIEASFSADGQDIGFRIFFFGCKKSRCASVQYFVAFEGDASKAVKWNEDNRFARAYMAGKLVRLEYDVDFESGATSKAVKNSAERWKTLMVEAVSYMN